MDIRKEGNIIFDRSPYNKTYIFKDRVNAGKYLAKICKYVLKSTDIVYAIPMGGVPIGYEISKELNVNFDLVICRKLLIPWNREAGFGAVDPSGNIFIDKNLVLYLGLSKSSIEKAIKEQLREIEIRNKVLRGGRGYPDLTGKSVLLVDDGIAAGYTMKAAINFMKNKNAAKIYIAVPTGSLNSIMKLSEKVDLIICANIRDSEIFAVADAYQYWTDLTVNDIMKYLQQQ